MGDRTYVTLTVLTKHADQVSDMAGWGDVIHLDQGLSQINFEDVNYADLEIEKDLQTARIPYDKEWEAGCEYGAGVENFRILPDGTTSLTECYNDDAGISVDKLNCVVDNSELSDAEKVVAIRALIDAHCYGKFPPFNMVEQAKYI